MPDEPQYPYARHRASREITHISEAPDGSRDFVCPGCEARFVVVRGLTGRAHHFRHFASNPDCTHTPESNLHLGAKAAIIRAGWVTTPPLYARDPSGSPQPPPARPTQTPRLTAIQQEFRGLPGIVPDLYATDPNGNPLIIEIHVAHAVDLEKQAKIVALNIRAIEIDLARDADAKTVLNTAPRRWVHHPEQARLDAERADRIAAEREMRLRETQEAEAHRLERLRQLDAERAEREARWVLEDADRQAAVEAENQRRRETEAQRRVQEAMLNTYRHELAVASARSAVEAYERCWQSVPDGAAVLQRAYDRLKAVEEGRPWP